MVQEVGCDGDHSGGHHFASPRTTQSAGRKRRLHSESKMRGASLEPISFQARKLSFFSPDVRTTRPWVSLAAALNRLGRNHEFEVSFEKFAGLCTYTQLAANLEPFFETVTRNWCLEPTLSRP